MLRQGIRIPQIYLCTFFICNKNTNVFNFKIIVSNLICVFVRKFFMYDRSFKMLDWFPGYMCFVFLISSLASNYSFCGLVLLILNLELPTGLEIRFHRVIFKIIIFFIYFFSISNRISIRQILMNQLMGASPFIEFLFPKLRVILLCCWKTKIIKITPYQRKNI